MHIPLFLIASITSSCNLHCAGCYSRCNHATQDSEPVSQLTSEEWFSIFQEADEIGVSYILPAGGEMRRAPAVVLRQAEDFSISIHMAEPSRVLFHHIRTRM